MTQIDWLSYFNREEEAALDAGDRLRHLLQPRRVTSVLDASAGMGLRAISLARAGFDVVACEPDETLLARAGEMVAEAKDVSIPLYRLGLRGVGAVAEGPFDAIVALGDAVARWPHGDHATILRDVRAQLVPAGYLVLGLRDWDAQLRTQDYFIPRQVTRMNGSRLLMFEVWEYATADSGATVATTFYLHTHGEQWRVETTEREYFPIQGNEFQGVVEAAGFQLIELVEHPEETWWILRKTR